MSMAVWGLRLGLYSIASCLHCTQARDRCHRLAFGGMNSLPVAPNISISEYEKCIDECISAGAHVVEANVTVYQE
jgi:hypothetical protein